MRASEVPPLPAELQRGVDWDDATRVFVAVGYASRGGVQELISRIPTNIPLSFVGGGGPLQTSVQAAEVLLARPRATSSLYYEPGSGLFHPKLTIVDRRSASPLAYIGSSNATTGGLRTNIEVNVRLDLDDGADRAFATEIATLRSRLTTRPAAMRITAQNIDRLLRQGHLYDEAQARRPEDLLPTGFNPSARFGIATTSVHEFAMSLARNDVSGRHLDNYFLVPIRARDERPHFWGWPGQYEGETHPGRAIRMVIRVPGLPAQRVEGRIYFVAARNEFRVACRPIHQLGENAAGWLLCFGWDRSGRLVVDVFTPETPEFTTYYERCTRAVSDQKRYGYL